MKLYVDCIENYLEDSVSLFDAVLLNNGLNRNGTLQILQIRHARDSVQLGRDTGNPYIAAHLQRERERDLGWLMRTDLSSCLSQLQIGCEALADSRFPLAHARMHGDGSILKDDRNPSPDGPDMRAVKIVLKLIANS